MAQATTGELVKSGDLLRDETRMARLVGTNIKSPIELRQRIEEIQQHAFVLSPMTAISSIAPGYEITPVVVVIDPSVDPESGRGADVYFQRSIHKSKKVDRPGGGYDYLPVEVSLNAQGLARILAAVGVNVHDSIWTQDGSRERYLWVCETAGDVIEFDGRMRKLPAGIGSLDARDGSADIGEWTPEEWAKRVQIAEAQKANTPEREKWKVKPEPINGWTAERVAGVRKYGRQLAKTKSLNGLARRLGVRQSYTIDELKRKPFVVMRPMFMPDMSNTEIAKMVTAANLGARFSMYPGAALPSGEGAPITHGHGEPMHTLPGEVVGEVEPEPVERMKTASPPTDAAEIPDEEPAKAQPLGTIYTVTNILGKGKGADAQYFVETKEGITLFFTDPAMLKPMQAAKKDGQPREISTERVMVGDQPYRQIVEWSMPGGLKY
jgi:hypothetical protein